MTVSIVTRAGALTLDGPPTPGQTCDLCPAPAQVRGAIDLPPSDELVELGLCAGCIVDALAEAYSDTPLTGGTGDSRRVHHALRDLERDERRDQADDDPLGLDPLGPTR